MGVRQLLGQFGWFYTYNNSIPDYQSADTLSHLYTYYGSSGPFDPGSITWVEVGYIQGFGYPNSYSTPHYWYALADHGAFDTVTSSSSATIGSTVVYETLFEGHNYNMGTDDWNLYWNGLGTVRATIHQSSQPSGHAMAGGEAIGDGMSSTQMHTHGKPDQEIVLQGYTWKSWTTYFTSTEACKSSGSTFAETTDYTDYTASGSAG